MNVSMTNANVEYAYNKNIKRNVLQSSFKPIRILFDYSQFETHPELCKPGSNAVVNTPQGPHQCVEEDVLTPSKIDFVKQTLEVTNKILSEMLTVLPLSKIDLKLNDECGHTKIYKSETIIADLVIIVTGLSSTQRDLTAYAAACQNEPERNRPVVGAINFCPRHLPNTVLMERSAGFQQHVATCLHEIMHILAFSERHYDKFIDVNNGKSLISQGIKVLTKGNRNGKMTNLFHGKSTLREAKAHFGCTEMIDVEMDDTSAGHFEARIFRSELMEPQIQLDRVMSSMTLALLQDSGWYFVDFSKAESFVFGRGQGCDFVLKSCANWQNRYHLCSKDSIPNHRQCSWDLRYIGFCSLKAQPFVDNHFKYFPNSDLTGTNKFVDYCPFAERLIVGACHQLEDIRNKRGEQSGVDSRCFESSIVEQGSTVVNKGPVCYRHLCLRNKLFVAIGDEVVECPLQGGNVTLPTTSKYVGEIQCWPYGFLCGCSPLCNKGESCLDGVCFKPDSLDLSDALPFPNLPGVSNTNIMQPTSETLFQDCPLGTLNCPCLKSFTCFEPYLCVEGNLCDFEVIDQKPSSSNSSSNTILIVMLVIVFIAVLFVVIAVVVFIKTRRRRQQSTKKNVGMTPINQEFYTARPQPSNFPEQSSNNEQTSIQQQPSSPNHSFINHDTIYDGADSYNTAIVDL